MFQLEPAVWLVCRAWGSAKTGCEDRAPRSAGAAMSQDDTHPCRASPGRGAGAAQSGRCAARPAAPGPRRGKKTMFCAAGWGTSQTRQQQRTLARWEGARLAALVPRDDLVDLRLKVDVAEEGVVVHGALRPQRAQRRALIARRRGVSVQGTLPAPSPGAAHHSSAQASGAPPQCSDQRIRWGRWLVRGREAASAAFATRLLRGGCLWKAGLGPLCLQRRREGSPRRAAHPRQNIISPCILGAAQAVTARRAFTAAGTEAGTRPCWTAPGRSSCACDLRLLLEALRSQVRSSRSLWQPAVLQIKAPCAAKCLRGRADSCPRHILDLQPCFAQRVCWGVATSALRRRWAALGVRARLRLGQRCCNLQAHGLHSLRLPSILSWSALRETSVTPLVDAVPLRTPGTWSRTVTARAGGARLADGTTRSGAGRGSRSRRALSHAGAAARLNYARTFPGLWLRASARQCGPRLGSV
jgi:hypothetical protein